MATHPIHWIYRACFHYFEPLLALSGSVQITFNAPGYLAIANPNITYDKSLQPLFTSIMGGWLMLAFNDAVTLRVFSRDTKVWWYVLFAHLISDIVYAYAVYEDLGAERFFNPMIWNAWDWLTIGTTIPPLVLKVGFLLGIGVNNIGRNDTVLKKTD
jgi:hypothetical protein